MRFIKMHGCENDYVVLDGLADPSLAGEVMEPGLARALCDRRSGIGADGVLVLEPSETPTADARMRIINADGTGGGMCGNGARCAVKHLLDSGRVSRRGDGLVRLMVGQRVVEASARSGPGGTVTTVRLDMGPVSFEPESLPFDPAGLVEREGGWLIGGQVWHVASIGNPHSVAFVEEPIDGIDLSTLGPLIELHESFGERTNVHIVNVGSPSGISMRSWERGCGETRACGSGACAVVAIGMKSGRLGAAQEILVRVLGGELLVSQDQNRGSIQLEGPAVQVSEGRWPCAGGE